MNVTATVVRRPPPSVCTICVWACYYRITDIHSKECDLLRYTSALDGRRHVARFRQPPPHDPEDYVHIYIYIYMCVHVYGYMYTYV